MGITISQQYDALYKKTLSGMNWIDDPLRTQEEIEKWSPKIKQLFDEITRLEMQRRMKVWK